MELRRVSPAEIDAPRIGHLRFFRPRFAPTLWQEYFLPVLGDNS